VGWTEQKGSRKGGALTAPKRGGTDAKKRGEGKRQLQTVEGAVAFVGEKVERVCEGASCYGKLLLHCRIFNKKK